MQEGTAEAVEQARRRRRRNNLIFGATMAVAALLFGLFVIPAGVGVPGSVAHLPLSPRFFPYVLTGLIFLFSLAFVVMTLFGPPPLPDDEDVAGAAHPRWKLRIGVLSAVLLAYAFLSETIGMLPMAIVATLALMLVAGERRPLLLGGAGILGPAVVYYFFTDVAQVPMPAGPLLDWR